MQFNFFYLLATAALALATTSTVTVTVCGPSSSVGPSSGSYPKPSGTGYYNPPAPHGTGAAPAGTGHPAPGSGAPAGGSPSTPTTSGPPYSYTGAASMNAVSGAALGAVLGGIGLLL